jgi:hypothetical protein
MKLSERISAPIVPEPIKDLIREILKVCWDKLTGIFLKNIKIIRFQSMPGRSVLRSDSNQGESWPAGGAPLNRFKGCQCQPLIFA